MKHSAFFLIMLVACLPGQAEDDVPFPLGSLSAKAFQSEGSSLLKVTEVTAGGPAATAGLQVGDYIYAVNGERLPNTGVRYDDGWRGAVSELGYALERSESGSGALSLGVLRSGTGALTLNATLPVTTAWRPSYPVGDPRMQAYFDKICADLHGKTQSSSDGNFGYNTGFFGIILLAHPDWNSTSAPRPYRNSINKLKDRCVALLNAAVLEPKESTQPGYVDPGLENWDLTASAMFLGEYRRKTGDTSVDAAVQRSAELIANRIQHYPQSDNGGTVHNKLGLMGHGGVVGDYPHVGLSGLNIINAHAMVAMGILKGAGANFAAASGGSGLTIDQKYLMNWSWLKSTMNTSGGNDDGNVGYGWAQSGYDSAGRTSGAAAGYEIYRAAGGAAATAEDLDKLARMKAYTMRNWQRQQHAHAYTVGGTAFSQMAIPFIADREQRFFLENSRFLLTMSRDHAGQVVYFPGRANNGGDSYLDFNNVRYIMPGLVWAIASGNLPSFPAPSASRAFVRMNSPRNDWPQLAARRAKVVGLVQNLDLDVTNHQGSPLASGYTAAWSQVSGASVAFSTTNTADSVVTFPSAGNYRLRFQAVVGAYTVTEDYDFEVATTSVPPDTSATITRQPISRAGVPGGSANFSTIVTGGGPFLYQWKLDGVDYWGPSSSATLSLPNLGASAAGNYQCTILHPGGQVQTSQALLSLAGGVSVRAGGLKREVWNNLGGGAVADLTSSTRYPRFPDVTSVVTSAEGPVDYGDDYGQRLSGWLIPPTTGSYRFYVSSDDASELWLSTDATPANKTKIAQIAGWTSHRNYSAGPSGDIALTAGQRYYIEALQKEGGGGDHLSVTWRKPGEATPANGSAPIPGAFLAYEGFIPDPDYDGLVSWWKLDEGSGSLATDSLATANDGALNGPTWTSGKLGDALLFDSTDKVFCSNAGALSGLTPFTTTAWVKVNAGSSTNSVIVQQRAANGFNGQYQLLVRSTGKVGFYCYGDSNEQFNFSGATSVNDGQWHHVAGMRDASGGAKIYVDGALDGSVSGTTVRNLQGGINVGIGADIRDDNRHFRGSLDDIRIYNRVLTPYQIWAQWHVLSGVAAPLTANPSADGLPNLVKYAFGLDPGKFDQREPNPAAVPGLPSIQLVGSNLSFDFVRRSNDPSLSYHPEWSRDMVQWFPASGTPVISASGVGWEKVLITHPASTEARLMARVRVIATP